MRENFDRSFTLTVMQFEGGSRYTNDPDDPGQGTKYGLSQRANPDLDIVNLTEQQAQEIYLQRYWTPLGCDESPYPWDMVVFDTGVNLGVKRALALKEKAETPADFHMERITYYCNLVSNKPIMAKYIRGWVNRVVQLWQQTKG
jgi:lysozyme family protein